MPSNLEIKINNDYRPVALTAIIMKCLERIVLSKVLETVKPHLDPLQFAYCAKRGVEDAVLTLLHFIQKHLDKRRCYVRVLMVDFSSAFNTIQPHLMMEKLDRLGVNANITLWVCDFLTGRLQHVRVRNIVSDTLVINTGAPQGCVISPVLFTLYTNDCRSSSPDCDIDKYADDTAILAFILCDDETVYRAAIQDFANWCIENYLDFNAVKTKELIFDFRKIHPPHEPIQVANQLIEIVSSYKYLGNIIDDKLTFHENVLRIVGKCNQRLYFLRKLKQFKVDQNIMVLFYSSVY